MQVMDMHEQVHIPNPLLHDLNIFEVCLIYRHASPADGLPVVCADQSDIHECKSDDVSKIFKAADVVKKQGDVLVCIHLVRECLHGVRGQKVSSTLDTNGSQNATAIPPRSSGPPVD
nr:hypothetical protein CFP56_37257 [Quercus suber]